MILLDTSLTNERALWVDAVEWFEKHADHDPNWADACLAVPLAVPITASSRP